MNVGVFLGGHRPEAGGGFTFENEILRHLIELAGESQHHFTIIVRAESEASVRRMAGAADNVDIARWHRGGLASRIIAKCQRESPFVRANWRRPTALDRVVKAHGLHFIWFLGPGCHLVNTPYLTVVWDLQHRLTPWFPEFSAHGVWDARELSIGWFLRRASIIVTGTQIGKEQIARFYGVPDENIRILPHPTPRLAVAPKLSEELEAVLDAPFLLYPAQLWPHKNHANLLHALRILRERDKLVVRLVLPGSDRGNRLYLESLAAELGVRGQVHFLGFVEESELALLYRRALALVYVSFCGPENLPPLEAFALGCPVVASAVPGAAEQLGDCALLVDPASPQSIAGGIRTIVTDSSVRERLRSKGLMRAGQWTGADFVMGVFSILDEFQRIRFNWA